MKHSILSAAWAVIYALTDFGKSVIHPLFVASAQPAYGDDDPLNAADVQDFANKDLNRLRGNVTRALARKSPYLDILQGGTLENGLSDTVRSVVQEQAVLNQSLTRPEFRPDTEMCGKTGESAEVGSTEYSYSLGTLRGMGPLVCVKGMRNAFAGSYAASEDALRKQIIQLTNADVRSLLVDRSGLKLVVKTSQSFEGMFTGNSQAIDTLFEDSFLPDASINFSLLEYLSIYMRENFLVDGFAGTQSEPLLKFIGGQDVISNLRDEAEIRTDHRYLASGQYKYGEKSLTGYTWEGPYRGFALGIDSQPLRFSSVDGDGQPVYIEPEIAVETDKGVAARINPLWARALFEVCLVVGADSFKKLAPESYNGEAGFKFPPQLYMGELKFKVIQDNADNVWADFGRHFYQISRAYQPIRPHAVCAIAFKRKSASFNLTALSNYPAYSSSDSL